ncbi:hypothetical protein [Humibacter sp. RRB41]|uniref:hypothetical protein n=1 Tax=Humibacter sp. RRB41 TaxID=2919946 RepID=UPI001FA9C311|nr:hypothetical protein [Humibacter sp. RRB41]
MSVFDIDAFYAAIDRRRREEALSWLGLVGVIWDQSDVLNARRNDHPIAPATIGKLATGKSLSCQHALFVLRWLDLPPEAFIDSPVFGTAAVALPMTDSGHRLRWNLGKLYATLNAARISRGATWQQTAERLHRTPSQLTGLRTAKFGAGIETAMRATQALHRPAAEFVYAAEW